jgi:DNA-binding helix-hairpin-helix protein with protein kinase domain
VVRVLTTGTLIDLPKHGSSWRVGALLGEGGQGAVFALEPASGAGPSLALKWYRPEAAHPEQQAALVRLAQHPPPSEAIQWPIEGIEGADGGFG